MIIVIARIDKEPLRALTHTTHAPTPTATPYSYSCSCSWDRTAIENEDLEDLSLDGSFADESLIKNNRKSRFRGSEPGWLLFY